MVIDDSRQNPLEPNNCEVICMHSQLKVEGAMRCA
jgi:hypothetical protein